MTTLLAWHEDVAGLVPALDDRHGTLDVCSAPPIFFAADDEIDDLDDEELDEDDDEFDDEDDEDDDELIDDFDDEDDFEDDDEDDDFDVEFDDDDDDEDDDDEGY